jgi:hypothetical protein
MLVAAKFRNELWAKKCGRAPDCAARNEGKGEDGAGGTERGIAIPALRARLGEHHFG